MSQIPSDYILPHVDVNKKLPTVSQDALTEALSESIFNRFYTQPELQRVIGTIGHSPTTKDLDQILEGSVFDQAFQLQPIITNDASTVQELTTYKDLMRSFSQLGIDPNAVRDWQTTDPFNFAPPINIDKLLNWNEYYWLGEDNPQYIVIENSYVELQNRLNQMVQQYVTVGFTPYLWKAIYDTLNQIHTVVPTNRIIEIKDLATVLHDPSHSAYVYSPAGDLSYYSNQSDWAMNNHWYHISAISDISSAKQARLPIIEYSNTVQMTEWTRTKMLWKYRRSAGYPWMDSSDGPSQDELFTRYAIVATNQENDCFTIDGDFTKLFVPGFQFIIQDSSVFGGTWTVKSAVLDTGKTVITVNENVISDIPTGTIVPFTKTSKGDVWTSLNDHWMFVGEATAVPSVPPTSLNVNYNKNETFIALAGQTSFSLSQYYLMGNDIARVYVNGRRQLGTYVEDPIYRIRFYEGLNEGDIVAVFPFAAAGSDSGKELVQVRTSTDDSIAPQYVSLVEYRKQEQLQTSSSQYPLFDLVTIDGQSTGTSTSLFAFTEDATAPVNSNIGKRVVVDLLTKDYSYTTGLVNSDGSLNYYVDAIDGICSVWRKDVQLRPYIPAKVNANRIVDENNPDAVFEIPKTFTNNAHHETKGVILHSELFTHFKSISDNQEPVDPNLFGSILSPSNNYRMTTRINYGAGGTIKEYNYGFDRSVSSVISSDHSVLDIIDFAEEQYTEMLVSVRDSVESNLITILTASTTDSIGSIVPQLVKIFLTNSSNDSNLTKIFGDSSCSLNNGVQNWISTLPYFGFVNATHPELLIDPALGLNKFIHHDGHTLTSELNSVTTAQTIRNIVKLLNLYPNGVQQPRPMSPTAGQMWFDSSTNTLYRYDVAVISSIAPITTFTGGAYWLNSSTNAVYRYINNKWATTTNTPADLWTVLDITNIVLRALIQVETSLFKACPNIPSAAVIDALDAMTTNQTFQSNLYQEFANYCNDNGIVNPTSGNYDATNSFTWNYSNILVGGQTGLASWTAIYQYLYNTEYPHLQPWKIQGYDTRPVWWDMNYAGIGRRWNPQMWTNIQLGIIPVGQLTPSGDISNGLSGTVPGVQKLSVNISATTTPDGILPDGLFPPYWVSNNPSIDKSQVLLSPTIGSADDIAIITNTKNNVFPFGSEGPAEYQWKNSLEYQYGNLRAWFKTDPVRFLHFTFGEPTVAVDGLFINPQYNRVPSHTNTIFHGDSDDNGIVQYFNGINQWYVQFFRSNALDLNGSEFKRAWNTWDTKLGYDVGSFLVDKTLSIDSTLFEITPNDYNIAIKKASLVRDIWADALYLNVYQQGSRRELPLGAGRDWAFSISTASPISRPHSYYGVKKYRVQANDTNNLLTMTEGSMSVAGWSTGDSIVFDLGVNGILPNAVDNMNYYFLIKVSDTTFMLANSATDAIQGKNITLESTGSGIFYVAELTSTYFALGSQNTSVLWKHFTINKNDVRTFTSNVVVTGIQNVADLIDGYSEYMIDQGFVFNDSSVPEYDATNNRIINWQYVTENMIDVLYKTTSQFDTLKTTTAKINLGTIALNPFSNNLWISHPTGIVTEFNGSNVRDVSTHAMVYDSNGDKINNRDFIVLRKDQITQLLMVSSDGQDTTAPLNLNGFSGAHVYFDEYDQVILFNPYTISGSLIYDSFLGIAIPKVHAYFEKQVQPTKRPNVGGFLLNNGALQQNYEYTVGNVQKYYDTFTVNENADFVNNARALLGYAPNASYMLGANVTPKSQFLFYKGMIKAKGTKGSIQAFTNNLHFQASELDEFWAYRSYDFGDKRPNVSYSLALYPEDTQRSHVKLQFVDNNTNVVEDSFTSISSSDTSRWVNYPTQAGKLSNVNSMLGLKLAQTFTAVPFTVVLNGVPTRVIQHPMADDVLIYKKVPHKKVSTYAGSGSILLDAPYVREANALSVFKNGVECIKDVDYLEVTDTRIQLITSFQSSDVIVVVWGTATLREGIHYTRINSRIVVPAIADLNHLTISIFVPRYNTFAPIKLYDAVSQTTVNDIMPWDPAKGYHVSTVASLVDIFNPWDPATYNNNPDATNETNFWSKPEVGTVWADQNSYQYLNYSDNTLSTNDKLLSWGAVASWSDASVYQWVESSIAPELWDSSTNIEGVSGTTYKVVYHRDRPQFGVTSNANIFTTLNNHGLASGEEVAFSTSDTLPSPLLPNVVYVVDIASGNSLSLVDRDGNPIVTTDSGIGQHIIFPAKFTQPWYRVQRKIENYEALVVDLNLGQLTVTLPAYQEYSMYVDGIFVQDGSIPTNQGIVLEQDTLDIIRDNPAQHTITVMNKLGIFDETSTGVIPNDQELTGAISQEYAMTPSSVVRYVNEASGADAPKYYFWVRGMQYAVNGSTNASTTQLESMLTSNSNPYMLCLDPNGGFDNYYNKLIIAGISGSVTDSSRYILRFIDNQILRQELRDSNGSLLKPVYSEWVMFRANQNQTIDRVLWNMVMESILGYSLLDPTVVIPSLDRVVYDNINNTNTRYGMDVGQAFVSGPRALETILSVINNPEIDYRPIDMDYFLQTHDITTSTGLYTFLDDLYKSLPAEHINPIFFAVMMDALTNSGVDYSSHLMKTSAISVSGIAPLNVNGEFDE